MTDLPERMIDAAARAMWCAATGHEPAVWERGGGLLMNADLREYWRRQARAAVVAALAEAEQDGALLVRVPGNKSKHDTEVGDDWGYAPLGWNACRAATIAGKVTL